MGRQGMGAAIACLAWWLALTAQSQRVPGYNYDESKIPPYRMLDPLLLDSGRPVTTAGQWWYERRPEILRLFEENIYGRTPPNASIPLRAHVVEADGRALGGRAIRKQIDICFTAEDERGPKMRLLLYLPVPAPAAKARAKRTTASDPVAAFSPRRSPVVLGLNFGGNQTVLDDAAIQPTPVWSVAKGTRTLDHTLPSDTTRGTQTQEWQVEKAIGRGYGLATAYYGDIEPDFKDAEQHSVRRLFLRPGQTAPTADEWGAIGAWAWGLSRAVDYLAADPDVDAGRIAVTGHSRLGKAADWAAAQDPRIAVVLSTESGKGGQSLSRREMGETVQHLEHSFPYWFCGNYARWAGHDQEIPADGNLLLSLIAPRPLYVASAEGDEFSDPRGEFLSAVSASRVYELLGKQGLASSTMPGVNQPILDGQIAYHVRSGVHDVTAFDWDQYLRFLDLHFGATAAGKPERR